MGSNSSDPDWSSEGKDPLTRYLVEKYGVLDPEDDIMIVGLEFGF